MLLILFLMTLILFVAAYIFTRIAIYPKVIPYQETRQREIEAGHIPPDFDSWAKEELTIRSPLGYDLHAVYFPIEGSKKTAILAHGITVSLYFSVKYMPMFRKRGFNILAYDHRYHGLSGGPNCTFGFYEKYDMKAVADWAFERLGPGGKVGTFGESLGAGTALQNSAIDPRLSFVIADCPYSDLFSLFSVRGWCDYHIPPFPLIYFTSLVCYLVTGMKLSDVSPIRAVAGVPTPMLICHGQQDEYVPTQMGIDLQRAKQNGISRIYLAPNAGHAEAFLNNQTEYDQKVGEFLQEIGL